MTAEADVVDDPRFLAGVDMLRRTGATEVQVRLADDEAPIVWMALACHLVDEHGRPTPGGKPTWSVAAALNPTSALMRLLERLVDGGQCPHCKKPAAFDPGFEGAFLEEGICWTQFDPERATFRRGCE